MYIHLSCTVDGGQSFNSQPGKQEYQRKKSVQTVNIKKTSSQVNVCKIISVPLEGYKKLRSQRINEQLFNYYNFCLNLIHIKTYLGKYSKDPEIKVLRETKMTG